MSSYLDAIYLEYLRVPTKPHVRSYHVELLRFYFYTKDTAASSAIKLISLKLLEISSYPARTTLQIEQIIQDI